MIISGFSLEILVNGKPLKEYSEPTNKKIMTTGPSYVLDKNTGQKIESDKTFYAAVEELGTNYVVQYAAPPTYFSPSLTTLKAKLFVDGQWDHTCKKVQKFATKARKDGFFDEQRQKHLFRFDVTCWVDDSKEDSKNNMKCLNTRSTRSRFGGIGAVSIYFYKAEEDFEKDEKLNNNNKIRIQKVKVPESTGIESGMKISTGFEKSQNIKMASNKMLRSTLTIPVAVLHIHYRPACWLRTRNILYDNALVKIEKNIDIEFKKIKSGNEIEYIKPQVKAEEEKTTLKKELNEIKDIQEEKKISVKREFVETEESEQKIKKKPKIKYDNGIKAVRKQVKEKGKRIGT